MSEVREEYTRETYPSFGKKYAGEKAIISMTSWAARIATCSKTIFSLLTQCPGFHIVLVLSEEEFPKMMDELPDNLKLFVDNELIEVLWVFRNYKSFKKVLFTMDKYRDVPVISADDDCIYTCNYALELYDAWVKDKKSIFTFGLGANGLRHMKPWPTGSKSLYPPNCFKDCWKQYIEEISLKTNDDDTFYSFMINEIFKLKIKSNCPGKKVYFFHNEISPMHSDKNKYGYDNAIKWINKIYKL